MKETNNEHTEVKRNKKVYEFVKKIDSRKFVLGMRWKLVVVFAFIIVVLVYLGIVMTNINRNNKDLYSQKVFDNLRYKNNTILAKRGDITDSTGTILAYSKMVYNLILDPNEFWKDDTDREKNIDVLVQCFGCDRNELLEIFNTYEGAGVYYKRYISCFCFFKAGCTM